MVTIGLTGDVMIGRTLDQVIHERGYDYPWGNMLATMRATDINIINLETTLTGSTDVVKKTFNFKATPDKINSLERAGISVANLANNHILDFGVKGLLETISVLDENGIKHVGAGRNQAEAFRPLIITKNDLRIGVLGMTDNEPDWKAGNAPGICYIDPENAEEHKPIFNSVAQLRKQADMVIVSIHWGPNMRERPTTRFMEFARGLCHHGASVIHGHSAHILQGIEIYNNSIILYDTGDFVDDYAIDPELRNDLAAFFVIKATARGPSDLRIIPTRISDCQVNEATGEDYRWIMDRLAMLSSDIGTRISPDGEINLSSAARQKKRTPLKK